MQPHPALLVPLLLLLKSIAADNRVHILSENLDQAITSTTLQWVQTDGKDASVLEYAVVAAYQVTEEIDTSENSENAENEISRKKEPVYICRATVTSVWVTGQLRPKNQVCVVSLYKKVQEYRQFEVLVNIENSGRLSWVGKNKFTNQPIGAVTNGETIHRAFVARKAVKNDNKPGSLTHYVGAFDPSENLGVFHLVDQYNNETSYEEGELLVETEPMSYDFKNIRFQRPHHGFPRKKKMLAHAVLKNEEDGLQRVESVMSYNYTYYLNWGKGHGIQIGLNYTVFLPNGSQVGGRWGTNEGGERVDTVPVEMYLEQGTAVNITLYGNYTEMEIPYSATLVSHYSDGEVREITIRDIKRENKITELVFEYSPVYFLHNNSLVPTTPPPTTTTTTTTTTKITTTLRTTWTTHGVVPMAPPEVIVATTQEELNSPKKQDSSGMVADQDTARDAPEESKIEAPSTGAASKITFLYFLYMLLPIIVRRVT